MSKKPKTQGLEWLVHSLMSFNGSGYADMNSAEDYLDSYVAYKTMKHKPEAVLLAKRYKDVVLPTIQELLDKTLGASRQPSRKIMAKVQAVRDQGSLL